MNGIIVIDKPAGWTSHDVVAKLRGALKEKRIGHGGTLDPMATGVLPIFVGRATRAVEFCIGSDKEYIAGLQLGITTDTQDITGNILKTVETSVTAEELAEKLPQFLGPQKQTPPMHSAIKIDGKKLYDLARRGIEVPRPERDIHIFEIEILDERLETQGRFSCFKPETGGLSQRFVCFTLRVTCSKGTYIRTLCHDIGAALGCGGVMSSLRRTRAGAFSIEMAHPLDEALAASWDARTVPPSHLLMPVDSLFREYPPIKLGEPETRKCKNGAPTTIENTEDGTYRFYGPDNEFLLLGKIESGILKIIKGFYSKDL